MSLSLAPTIIGILLFGVGLFFFLKFFFRFTKDFYRPAAVFFIILIGIQMMFSEWRFAGNDSNTIVGKGPAISPTVASDSYNVFFGLGEHDFTSLPVGSGNTFIETNTVFAKTTIYIKHDAPVRILIYPMLGVVTLPNGLRIVPFFKNVYKTKAYREDAKAITLKINISLGAVEIIER
jgi:predicted membrane protein